MWAAVLGAGLLAMTAVAERDRGIPLSVLALGGAGALCHFIAVRTRAGRYVFALGSNAEAARYAGVDTRAVTTAAYVISGLMTGVSAILIAFYTNSISPSSHGNFYELYAIAAAVIGGCSLRGGEGSIVGIILGAAVLQVIRNLVNLMDIPSSLDFAVMGAVILVGAIADELVRSRSTNKEKE